VRKSKGRTFAVIVTLKKPERGGGGNRGGAGGPPPRPPEASGGFEGGAPEAETTFTVFSPKYPFLSILWSKFLLKNTFKMAAKSVLLRPQGMRPRALAPTLATPLNILYETASKHTVFHIRQ